MSIGSGLYAYRSNFSCKQTNTRKGKSTNIKPINLIIDGFRTVSKYDDDYFISLAQYFMKKGYPGDLIVNQCMKSIDSFFMKALFSVCPFHYESLYINKGKFDLFEWRKQFDLFNEIKIQGLNFYTIGFFINLISNSYERIKIQSVG